MYKCIVYAAELVKKHGHPPEGAQLIITSNPNAFGSRLSVSLAYDTNNPKHMEYLLKCEKETI